MGLLPDNLDFTRHHCTARESMLEGTRSLVLDNGLLRLALLPEYGARLCSLFYRPLNLELLASEFTRDLHHGLHVRGGWCAAFPSLLADGEILSRQPWEAEIAEQSDEEVVIRAWCLVERISHVMEGNVRSMPATIHVDRFVRLRAGQSWVEVEDVLTNRNIWPALTTWSGVISLRARAGDRVVLPVEAVEVQRGVGPSGNELDFGLLVTTPYQAIARQLHEGWIGYRMASTPVDVRLTFPLDYLPNAVIGAQRNELHPAEDAFRLQPLATPGPIADDTRGGALSLPPKRPLSLPLRMEIGAGILSGGAWSRPGMQLAELILSQQVPAGRVALWRVGARSMVLKSHRYLVLLMPDFSGDELLQPEDLPSADLILCSAPPPGDILKRLMRRTSARFIGPASLRQRLLELDISEERSIALSPGARVDLPGLGALATPARDERAGEQVGFLLNIDHLSLYHTGPTQFLGEFGPIGEQFHPQLVMLPVDGEMTLADAVNAAKLLAPRQVIPLGPEEAARDFTDRCRAHHLAFAVHPLHKAQGAFFDGWKLLPLG